MADLVALGAHRLRKAARGRWAFSSARAQMSLCLSPHHSALQFSEFGSVGEALGVSSRALMGHPCRMIRRMHYGTSSSRERHDDRGGPSSDTTSSREPEGAREALWRQPEDHRQVEVAEVSF